MDDEHDPQFEQLLHFLKEQRGFDFTGYKRSSLARRFRRQMTAAGIASFDEYLDYLQTHPEEFVALFNTILINVTSFFRDFEAWTYLRDDVLPGLLHRSGTEPLRLWSAGCATGEEAYSVAMLLADAIPADEFRARVKIYATDVDEEALIYARHATYTEREVRGLAPEQLERFFEKSGERYTFRKDLRRSVIFGRNDLVQDAPISHVDLLLCRNALMYFNAEAQARILSRLHFALRPDGVLFLGKAETLLSHGALFAPIDLKRRFFRKVGDMSPVDRRGPQAGYAPSQQSSTAGRLREEAFLSSPAAQLVIDGAGRLAMSNHRAETLFGLSARDVGRPFQDLEVSYRPLELRSWVEEAIRDRRPGWVREVEWRRGAGDGLIFDVQVVPLPDGETASLGATVIFNDVTQHRRLQHELEYANRQLETAYEELQSTNEELETTNEELQSTVEELETTNEELQSTNEELETMNQELQSMNDELYATNDALRSRSEEVAALNAFTNSILSSVHSAVAVVDHNLQVQAWNAGAEDLWGVRESEAVGRHLLNLDIGLPVEDLRPLLRRQLWAATPESHHEGVVLAAVNRRGRPVTVRVTVSPFPARHDGDGGAVIVMDLSER